MVKRDWLDCVLRKAGKQQGLESSIGTLETVEDQGVAGVSGRQETIELKHR